MRKVVIYTDGACSNNPGPGGYCAILMCDGAEKIVTGAELYTTNNRMELMGVIKGLNALKRKSEVDIYSDSAYVCNAILQGWLENWQKRHWKNSTKHEVLNKDLWLKLIEKLKFHKVTFHKVRGHADNEFNNRCDNLARRQILKLLKKEEKKANSKPVSPVETPEEPVEISEE